ncbi:MAG: DsbA family oxidoreductase [Rhizobiaceae bacterium]|nr:DsbA family oxidoreductase [Rhizobiaceae bacterium]
MKTLDIDIISDIVCPWCYLGQRRLALALESLAPDIDARIRWRPFQLEPDAPPEGFDTFDYLARKIGGPDRVRQSHEMLTRLGAEIGLPFALDKATTFPNTLDAHRLLHWAGEAGEDMQDKVAKALFTANFVEGRNVGDRAVLAGIAQACGMDGGDVARRLATDADRDRIRDDIAQARQMGVSGVPFFVIDGKYAISGAQGADVFANALRQIAGMKADPA